MLPEFLAALASSTPQTAKSCRTALSAQPSTPQHARILDSADQLEAAPEQAGTGCVVAVALDFPSAADVQLVVQHNLHANKQ